MSSRTRSRNRIWTHRRVRAVVTAGLAVLTLAMALAAPAQAAPLSYVALGDSYSSGVGTRAYIADGTSCQRSVYAYPSLLAAADGDSLTFRACSGATTTDVARTQLSALSRKTGLVTITVGGNDAGFVSVLTTCALPSWLSDCYGAIDTAQAYIAHTLPRRLTRLYDRIGRRRRTPPSSSWGTPASSTVRTATC